VAAATGGATCTAPCQAAATAGDCSRCCAASRSWSQVGLDSQRRAGRPPSLVGARARATHSWDATGPVACTVQRAVAAMAGAADELLLLALMVYATCR
jgi:hypothetical protein